MNSSQRILMITFVFASRFTSLPHQPASPDCLKQQNVNSIKANGNLIAILG